MLKLRRAVEADFENFKTLYENNNDTVDYHWMHYDDYNSKKERRELREDEIELINFLCGENALEVLSEKYSSYNLERFKKDLEKRYIYMIENDSEVIGYISMYYCPGGRYKIAEWAMFNPMDHVAKKETLNELLKLDLPNLSNFFVYISNLSTLVFFGQNGFTPYTIENGFFKLEVKNGF